MASIHTEAAPSGQSNRTLAPGVDSTLATLELTQLCQLTHGQIQHQNRKDIMLAVRRVLDEHQLPFSPFEVEGLAALARYLCDWPILRRLQDIGAWTATANEVALAEIQMGRFDKALSMLESALEKQPFDAGLHKAKQEISQFVTNVPYQLSDLQNGPVSLTPLNFNHVADFGWQYGDASIAKLCNLPKFPSAQHWVHWLHLCQQEKERRLFAVMHEEFGFIGSVSLQVFNGIGFFYYWLGADFQGLGLGPKAVDILMSVGRRYLGMECCYAKVFDFNKPSHRAIVKLGFERLPFKAAAPSEAEVFYYQGEEKDIEQHHKELARLLDKMNSGIDLVDIKLNAMA